MKIYEIKQMNSDEIVKRIEEEEKNLVDLRFAHQLKQLTNTAKLRNIKRDIARMHTVLTERKLNEKPHSTNEGANA